MLPSVQNTPYSYFVSLAKEFLASAPTKPDFSIIDQLCKQSFSNKEGQSTRATKGIFSIIETLCDDFSDYGVSLTNDILIHILQFIRFTKKGSDLDTLLAAHGFQTKKDFLRRYQALRVNRRLSQQDRQRVKKILILSRVTAGADIAITGVIINRLSQAFPKAKLLLIGPFHLREMFGDLPNTNCLNFIYKNDGSLFEKMTSWPKLLTITKKETLEYLPGEVLLFDPDSRLSQLGLLPLIEDDHTYLFPSRISQPKSFNGTNLSFLANQWLNTLLSENKTLYPKLTFKTQRISPYNSFFNSLKKGGSEFVLTVNLGVGNNPSKKIEGQFEDLLIEKLLSSPSTIVVLDTGRGQSELDRVRTLLAVFSKQGINTAEVAAENLDSFQCDFCHGLIAFKGPLAGLGKMIDATDCFIGYDSCGQHIATATRTPAVIIFAGAPTSRFIDRWAPTNKENLTIPVNSGSLHTEADLVSLIDKVHKSVNTIRSQAIVSE